MDFPICVDLDGTLLRGSTLPMVARLYLEQRLFLLKDFSSVRWAAVKKSVCSRIDFSGQVFEFRAGLVSFLKERRDCGIKIFLVTGADQKVADEVAGRIGLFHDAIGSDGFRHLVGRNKARYLAERFGKFRFAYIGDSYRDMFVWRYASEIIIVKNSWILVSVLSAIKRREQNMICRFVD
ncbi:haloacid dehalogenase-like hydrolase [Candidatus Hydrogenosomobacter endosymbioticus]|nr:haloacid dehalogenase-like hydrolase [Candidatus Hydrogenosomobacter endosymbioticus]